MNAPRQRTSVVQVCSRCGAKWRVPGGPAQWCPRCNGTLLAPGADGPRRTVRWVARRPDANVVKPAAVPAPPVATPRYSYIPRWGFVDLPDYRQTEPRSRLAVLGAKAVPFLAAAAIMFVLAALAEAGRYGILLRNRTRLIDPTLLAVSDATVWATGVLAPLLAIVAAVACVGWLKAARQRAFQRLDRNDPRSTRTLALGCLVPVVNLVFPGVFLEEFTRTALPRTRKIIRVWWCAWVFGAAIAVASVLWHFSGSLQGEADSVSFNAFADIVAACVALLTILVIRTIDGHDVLGRRRTPKRWTVATGPARPVIEPVRSAAERKDERKDETAQQEVMAK